MTFEVIEKDVERGDARLVLRCTECDEAIVVWDTLDEESTQAFEATEAHSCPPACLLCKERLPFNDVLIGARIDRICWVESPREAALALGAFIEARKMVV